MNLTLILFIVLVVVALASAIGLLVSRNTIYAALFLVLNYASVAVFYLLLGAPFIALVQVTVYAGAIMVLFLFVIMLLGADKLPRTKVLPWQRPAAIVLTVLLLAEAGLLLFQRLRNIAKPLANPGTSVNTTEALRTLGLALFNQYLLPFEVTSILLLVAMVGVIVLTKKEKGEVG
jgi:NADH-quinone oxidoreductase subunit J